MELFDWLTGSFGGKSLLTVLVSMLPVVELRGAIPLGVSLGLDHWYSMVIAIIGNMIPIPFVVIFVRRVFEWLQSKSAWLKRFVDKKIESTLRHRTAVRRSEFLALMVLVAVPLPGTGAWTGALLAALLNMRLKNAFFAIFLGVIIAGFVVMGVTYGFSSIFS